MASWQSFGCSIFDIWLGFFFFFSVSVLCSRVWKASCFRLPVVGVEYFRFLKLSTVYSPGEGALCKSLSRDGGVPL